MFIVSPFMKTISVLLLSAFFLVTGVSIAMGMNMGMDGVMSHCPFMLDGGSICTMSLAMHIWEWQQLFTASPTLSIAASLLLLFFCYSVFTPRTRIRVPLLRHVIKKEGRQRKFFMPLFQAFAQGILHSRLFA